MRGTIACRVSLFCLFTAVSLMLVCSALNHPRFGCMYCPTGGHHSHPVGRGGGIKRSFLFVARLPCSTNLSPTPNSRSIYGWVYTAVSTPSLLLHPPTFSHVYTSYMRMYCTFVRWNGRVNSCWSGPCHSLAIIHYKYKVYMISYFM